MTKIKFKEHMFECRDGESLLDACFRQRLDIPFSCRNGSCHICLMRAVSGPVPDSCQVGLSAKLVKSGHFLPCRCYFDSSQNSDTELDGELEVELPIDGEQFLPSKIISVENLSSTICAIELSVKVDAPYKAGQFINLRKGNSKLVRSYSLSSIYKNGNSLSIHVQKIPNGEMSNWLADPVRVGEEVGIQYPMGHAYFSGKNLSANRLLVATGSGLGASMAIVKEAIAAGCTGELHLFHGAREQPGLYLKEELQKLSCQHENFHYYACVTGSILLEGDHQGRATDIAFEKFKNLKGWEVYLYGNPNMVETAKLEATKKGAEEESIQADPFEFNAPFNINQFNNSQHDENDAMELEEEAPVLPEPDQALWERLDNGKILREALDHFYSEVYKDEKLSPFFKGVTKNHVAGKQYAFLNQIFTGDDVYFGDRPRNAHHWMVISNDLFDYREALFERCLRESGVDEESLQVFLKFDQRFRAAIVKTRPWPRISKGKIEPLKGFEEMVLDIGAMCDSCKKEVKPNTKIIYHGQTGELLCPQCTSDQGTNL